MGKQILIFVLILLLLVAFFYWQNFTLTVSRYAYASPKVGAGLDGYRIVQLSDLHNASFGKDNSRLLSAVAALQPDSIVMTGDAVDSYIPKPDVTVRFVREALELAPVYYVTGNHELRLPADMRTAFLRELALLGATVLEDQSAAIEHDGAGLTLLGLGDGSLRDDTLEAMTEPLPADSLKVLLAHEPQFFPQYSEAGVDLILAGHAHGGQFRLPLTGGLFAPGQGFFPKYAGGLYTLGASTMVVSRGLGNSVIPCRLGNRPDIVLLTLRAQEG